MHSSYIFNNKPADAVLLRLDPTGMGETRPVFRDYVAKDFLYVMEASPFGEIFFIERDLSKLIHEPVKSGIQRFLPPPNSNIRTVEAAIWL